MRTSYSFRALLDGDEHLAAAQTSILLTSPVRLTRTGRAIRLVRLNFLAPAIVEAILAGTQPASINMTSQRTANLPIDWNEQIALFGM